MWTDEAVLATAAAWFWTPFDAVVVDAQGFKFDIARGKASMRAWPGLHAAELVDAALRLAAEHGADRVEFGVHGGTRPAGLADELRRRGAEVTEELDISAYQLGSALPDLEVPAEVSVRVVSTMDDQRLAYGVDTASFGYPAPSEQFQQADAEELAQQVALGDDRTIFRLVAEAGSRPVGAAGMTLDGPVAKLWGAGVIPQYRGRGAYRALLLARLELANRRGATLALVKARRGTSGPILRRAGFRAYGRQTQLMLEASG